MNAPKMPPPEFVDALAKELTDRGELIAAGFHSYRTMVIPKDEPTVQVNECRLAFFAGAQHVFSTIMRMLDAGDEPSADDMRRMSAIQAELDKFSREFALRHTPTAGNG